MRRCRLRLLPRRPHGRVVGGVLAAACLFAAAMPAAAHPLGPLVGPAPEVLPPWRPALLPQQRVPATRLLPADLDGERVLALEARASYGNLLHPLEPVVAPADAPLWLAWRWRVERHADGSDLRRKDGDDAAVKVCALFDLALDRVPFVERQLLRLARSRSGEPLPAATLCYVWDGTLPAFTELDNAHSRRVRFVVLQGSTAPLAAWRRERRDLAADFLRVFGDEADTLPPLLGVIVGADSDNTGGDSLAHLADLELRR